MVELLRLTVAKLSPTSQLFELCCEHMCSDRVVFCWSVVVLRYEVTEPSLKCDFTALLLEIPGADGRHRCWSDRFHWQIRLGVSLCNEPLIQTPSR